MQAEIDAGYPVLVFLQPYNELYRSLSGMPKANPEIHGMLIYGYEFYGPGWLDMPVEVWTYNLGPHKLLRKLRFVGDELVEIRTDGYGY